MTDPAATALDLSLALGALAAAGGALVVRRRTTAIMLFLVFGTLLAIIWARLAAPDVALAEAAIGAGITGGLLLDAIGARREPPGRRVDATDVLAAVPAALLGGAAVFAVLQVSGDSSRPTAGALALERLGASGVDHPITAVLLNFRAYDTLLEIAVLTVAALATVRLHGPLRERTASIGVPFRTTVRLLVPVLVLIAGWLLVAGSSRPGGAFQAGAVLAGAMVLLHLSGTATLPRGWWLTALITVGLAVFLLLAAATVSLGAGWLALEEAWAGDVILAVEAALALSIAAALAGAFVAARPPSHEEVAR